MIPPIIRIYIDKILAYAVEDDDNKILVRFVQQLLRLHPYSHMLYCYRAGQIQNALNIIGSTTPPQNPALHKIWHRSHEIINVLKEGFEPQKHSPQMSNWQFNNHVLFTFHFSGNYDPAGYTVRSNAILKSLIKQKISLSTCTRLGYPWDLWKHRTKPRIRSSQVAGFTFQHFHDPDNLISAADSLYIKSYATKLTNLARKENTSVIHASSNFLNGLAAAKAAQQLGIKSVYEMRGLWHLTRNVREKNFNQTEYFRYCQKMEITAANLCDAVVAISKPLKHWLIDAGIAPEKIYVIPNAAEVGKDKISPTPLPSELNHVTKKFIVGFIGSLMSYEGIDLIINAVATLLTDIPNIHCVIIGDGYAKKTLKLLTSKLGIDHAVTFINQVPQPQIKPYYEMIDVFPLPRKAVDVCKLIPPLKPFEIMARKKPVIVSDLEPLIGIIKHKKTGLICEANNVHSLIKQIRLLHSQPELADKIAKQGQQWVLANRTWDHNAILYKKMYHQLKKTT